MGGIDVSEDLRKYVKNRIRYSPTYATEFGDDWRNINRTLGYTVKKGGADIMEVLAECVYAKDYQEILDREGE